MSVPLAVEDVVAVVYGVLLFVSPSNCRRIVMYAYTDCSSTQVVKCGTVLLVGRKLESYEIGVSSICTAPFLSSPLLLEKKGAH